ncbi:extracellular solute-binding protein [Nonomuraea turkmeniaca]|uniref:Extracellular solute-binding protein n=1 Tax=Nonomuraea turkmeniaca TaxID=103838 RepID=A0A5S4FXB6_9ACTN|nr:extracellular solute-binding protein [Nonomuraea turkmeniaca]TMR24914.1 extracellular solute-binding protein [Nonomuraea turkmeniaca]
MIGTPLSRRTVLKAAAGAAGIAVLAACGKDGGSTSTTGGALNVWGGVPPESGPNAMIEAFQKQHPGITVTYTRYVNDDQGKLKLDTSLQGGVPIDVFFSYDNPTLGKRVQAGLTADLTGRVKNDSGLAQFGPDASPTANLVYDGKIYSVPAQKAPTLIFANDTMLSEAGITIPDGWDINDYRDVAKKLSKAGKVFGTFSTPPIHRYTLGPDYYYSEDGKSSSFSDPAWRQYLELALAMQEEGSVLPRRTIIAEKLQTFSHGPLLTGRVAMLPGQVFVLRYISDLEEFPHDFKVRALPNPAPVKGQEFWNDGPIGDHISISAKSKQQDAAWSFVSFWMNNSHLMTKGGRLPSILDPSKQSQTIADLLGPERDKLYDVASFEKVIFGTEYKFPVDTITTASNQVDTIYKKLHDQVLLGQITVDQMLAQATKEADEAIKAAG